MKAADLLAKLKAEEELKERGYVWQPCRNCGGKGYTTEVVTGRERVHQPWWRPWRVEYGERWTKNNITPCPCRQLEEQGKWVIEECR